MDSMHGFGRTSDGSFNVFSVPVSMHTGAMADASRIVGLYETHSYVIDRGIFLPFGLVALAQMSDVANRHGKPFSEISVPVEA